MRMSEGVEWAVHACVNLAMVESDGPVPAARLAAFYELPGPYLTKHLQALARQGILVSQPGPRGGFKLGRRASDISILDIFDAVEGVDRLFNCQEIRRCGPTGDDPANESARCSVAQIFDRAERAWRDELAASTVGDLADQLRRRAGPLAARTSAELQHPGTS